MIAALSGTITYISETTIHLQQDLITFEVVCPHAQSLHKDQKATIHTYLHWNQEQGPSLFGFLNLVEKEAFLLIISCSGIGPKLGISILQQMDAVEFLKHVIDENITKLSALKHIGTKKAEQLCLNLRNKAPQLMKSHPHLATKTVNMWGDIQQTLQSLNYSAPEITMVVTKLKQDCQDQSYSFDQLLRKALQGLAKK